MALSRGSVAVTFLEGCLLVFLEPLGSDGLKPNSGGGVLLEHVPHGLLGQHEQVAVAHGAHGGGAAVACSEEERHGVEVEWRWSEGHGVGVE